jgi:hypothetical protein
MADRIASRRWWWRGPLDAEQTGRGNRMIVLQDPNANIALSAERCGHRKKCLFRMTAGGENANIDRELWPAKVTGAMARSMHADRWSKALRGMRGDGVVWDFRPEGEPTVWPKFRKVRQQLKGPDEIPVAEAVHREVARIADRIRPQKTYAIGVGSRGIRGIAEVVQALVFELHRRGAKAVIIPAMGSHGGGTAAGQREVLESLGVSEDTVGAPIEDDMAVERLASLADGTPVYFSRAALSFDGIIPVNRIKPHTDFHGPHESGLVKMLVIGFGKQVGAQSMHSRGFGAFERVLPEAGQLLLERLPVPFGLALVENGYERTAEIRALVPESLREEEQRLLDRAREWMARLPFAEVDFLLVGRLGKNISGSSMDPNVTGRWISSAASGGLRATRLTVLNLTEESHGNAIGLGAADTIPQHLFEAVDWEKTYLNGYTSTELSGARIPMVLKNDYLAVEVAIRAINGRTPAQSRTVVIRDTLTLEEFAISEGLAEEAQQLGLTMMGDWEPIDFRDGAHLDEVAGIRLANT